ncbi:MAG: ABC transporter substrate-binding protein [Gammaproteobacteria bacterium]|nr:ABC transporter substrate-binding protein [Gammaproteobacteria bacterium]
MEKVRLRLLWHPQPQFAGALVAQHSGIARARGLDLECQPLDFAEGPVAAILAENAEVCIASPAHLLESENPAALALLLVFQQKSSLVYPALRDHGVLKISDLAEKRVAVWPGGEDLELRWMLTRASVDPESVERVPTGDTAGLLLAGEVSCAQMTIYHEYHEYLNAGGQADRVLALRAADYGADLLKDGVIARRDWIQADPQRAQALVESLLEGWTLALRDRTDTLALCQQLRPDMDAAHHEQQYEDIRGLILNGPTLKQGLGYPGAEPMARAIEALFEVEGRKTEGAPQSYIAEDFWKAAPEGIRSANW